MTTDRSRGVGQSQKRDLLRDRLSPHAQIIFLMGLIFGQQRRSSSASLNQNQMKTTPYCAVFPAEAADRLNNFQFEQRGFNGWQA